jgi:hypothetical protein
MGAIATGFNTAFRDYLVEGVPASGVNPPDKSEARALGALIEDTFGPLATVKTVTADYTLILTDNRAWMEVNSASAVTITIPADADVAFPVGAYIEGAQRGTGAVNFAGAAGVTADVAENQTATTAGRGAVFGLKKIDTNEWRVFGNLAAA